MFGKRGHPEKVIREQGNRPLRSEDNAKKKDGRHKKGNGVPFVVTYYANFKNLSFLIHNNQQFLYVDPDTKRVFTSAPFIFFRTDRNLKSFLVRSKVYPLERKVGSAKCNGKRCQMCLSVNETDVSKSFQTEQKYKINHHYND